MGSDWSRWGVFVVGLSIVGWALWPTIRSRLHRSPAPPVASASAQDGAAIAAHTADKPPTGVDVPWQPAAIWLQRGASPIVYHWALDQVQPYVEIGFTVVNGSGRAVEVTGMNGAIGTTAHAAPGPPFLRVPDIEPTAVPYPGRCDISFVQWIDREVAEWITNEPAAEIAFDSAKLTVTLVDDPSQVASISLRQLPQSKRPSP